MSENPVGPLEQPRRKPAGKTREDKAELYKLAYEEGKRTVDDQIAELDSIRQRSVQFLAFIGTATAFLVGTSLKLPTRTLAFYVIAVLASLLMLASVALCLSLLIASVKPWSRKAQDWSFRLKPKSLVAWIEPDVRQPSESDYYRALAEVYEDMADENSVGLDDIRRSYIWFLGIAFVQLTLWLVLAWLYG